MSSQSTTRAASVEVISQESFNASVNNSTSVTIPCEATHFPLTISDFAYRLQSPIDEQEKGTLVSLLGNPGLVIPMVAHSQPSCPLVSLYLAYREIAWFIHVNQQPPNYSLGITRNQEHLLSALHQLGAIKVLSDIAQLPSRYANSPQHLFCSLCYHLGHHRLTCHHYSCSYCKNAAPGHSHFDCPLRLAHQRRKNDTKTARDPFYSPRHSSATPSRKHSSSSSSSSRPQQTRQTRRSRTPKSPPPRPVPAQRPDTPRPRPLCDDIERFIDSGIEEADNFDDSAIGNMTGEPYGDI